MKVKENQIGKVESPCLDCPNMVQCKKICYNRLEWGVFYVNQNEVENKNYVNLEDDELNIYGNNIRVKRRNLREDSEEVKQLLKEFEYIYQEIVVESKRVE